MKIKKSTLALFLGPAIILFIVFTLYPVLRTILMSLFKVNTITTPLNHWEFVGLKNYIDLFNNAIFKISLKNIVKIWFFSGIGTIGISLLFAAILNTDIKGKKFFTSLIYLPKVISPIAIGYAWLLYVYNSQFGLFKNAFSKIGLNSIANIQWLGPDMIFTAMVLAAIFNAIGQYTLMYISAMTRIPKDFYEVARIEGESKFKQFFTITLPLIKDVIKTSLVLFTTGTIGFFAFARIFSHITTVTPMLFTYNQIFGTEINPNTNVGIGAAAGVIMTLIGILFFVLQNVVVKDTDFEY